MNGDRPLPASGGRPLRYGSVCSGIEAASVAWEPLGWSPAWFAEIERFPSAVLAHRYPETPNHGDFTALLRTPPAGVDVLVGGTPCQAFSVAGLRGGLSDPRGNLALAFVALVDVLRPRWVVWENVPGVLSSGGGGDFGCFLGGLASRGYGWAYRVLDAQHFGVAQRRERVFVVASVGDFRRAGAVLFEPEGARGDSPKGASAWEGDSAEVGRGVDSVAPTLTKHGGDGGNAGQDGLLLAIANCVPAHSGICAPDLTNYFPCGSRIRRPTPVECERLQGFPDGYTLVPYRRKLAADGPRYKAIGNSMAVPVMRWIGGRIAKVDALVAGVVG